MKTGYHHTHQYLTKLRPRNDEGRLPTTVSLASHRPLDLLLTNHANSFLCLQLTFRLGMIWFVLIYTHAGTEIQAPGACNINDYTAVWCRDGVVVSALVCRYECPRFDFALGREFFFDQSALRFTQSRKKKKMRTWGLPGETKGSEGRYWHPYLKCYSGVEM